jgi:hypothetical protein
LEIFIFAALGINALALMLREEEAVDGEEYPEETNVGSEEVGATELLAELVETPETVCRTP